MKIIGTALFAIALASVPVWAQVQTAGIRNFHQVNENVYRGAQPTDDGFKNLASLGVKTVIDLRRPDEHSIADEARAVQAAGMKYVNIPMQGIIAPDQKDIDKAMALLNSGSPVFVHCKEGKDRTGTVIAVYRMSHDGWDNKRAMKEADSRGMHWFEIGMKSYLKSYRPTQLAQAAGTVQD